VAEIVSVQETDRGIVVCLLLEQRETSPELRTFASRRRRSTTRLPRETLAKLQTVLSVGPASPPPSLPEGPSEADLAFSRRQQQALRLSGSIFDFTPTGGTIDVRTVKEPLPRDTFVDQVRRLLPKSARGKLFGAAVAGISRGLAGVLGLQEDTVSAGLARQRNTTTQDVHFSLGVPSLGVPLLGGAVEGALRQDLLTVLENKDVRSLKRIQSTLESVPQLGAGKKKAAMLLRATKNFLGRLEGD